MTTNVDIIRIVSIRSNLDKAIEYGRRIHRHEHHLEYDIAVHKLKIATGVIYNVAMLYVSNIIV
jgi:hypothetical protein